MTSYSLRDNPIFSLGILITIEQGIGQGAVSLTHMIPAAWAPYVQNWCTTLAWIGGVIMTAFAAPGRVTTAPGVKAGIMLLALLVFWPAPAGAQSRRAPALTGNPVQDIKNAVAPSAATTSAGAPPEGGAIGQALAQALSKPFIDIANFINSDLDGAITLSTAIPSLQDGNGQQCWMALKSFGDVIKAHPLPLSGKAVTDLEAARLMTMAANRLCGEPHCTQVFADLANAATQAASLVPGAGAIQVPSLNSLCSHVPVVVVAAPIATPVTLPVSPSTSPATPATPSTPTTPPNP